MFLFCLVFAMFCARLFICALWSPAGKGLTSWLSFVVSSVSLSLSHWYPGSGVVHLYLIVSIPDLCTITYFDSSAQYCHRSLTLPFFLTCTDMFTTTFFCVFSTLFSFKIRSMDLYSRPLLWNFHCFC